VSAASGDDDDTGGAPGAAGGDDALTQKVAERVYRLLENELRKELARGARPPHRTRE
jgi:hypothetical protein